MLLAVLASVAVTSGCSADRPEQTLAPPLDVVEAGPPTYDASLEPASAVLALVPAGATTLSVTDYDQVRLLLGASTMTGDSPAGERARFWRRAEAEAPLLTSGLLRDDEPRLEADYGFTQDDVRWEATFEGPDGEGLVLALREDLPMGGVVRAVEDGVGPLAGAEVDSVLRLVTIGAADDPEQSWAADPLLASLIGPAAANATYVASDCVGFEEAFAAEAGDLAPAPADDLASLEVLDRFSVTLGDSLATVRMGPVDTGVGRDDAFERLRLGSNLPATDPELGLAFADGVADPSTGRIGYVMPDPAAAAQLVRERQLPFAVCR